MDYTTRNTIEAAAKTISDGLKAVGSNTPTPYAPLIDLTPIATAISDGLQAIATAMEYSHELEDRRLREGNK